MTKQQRKKIEREFYGYTRNRQKAADYVVGIQDQDRTEYCLRIQRAVEYKGNCDHEDIPSILKDYENLILSRLSVTTEREPDFFQTKRQRICRGGRMKHYYIVTYQSVINHRIMRRIVHISRYILIRWFEKEPDMLLSFSKINKKEAKYLGYKFD